MTIPLAVNESIHQPPSVGLAVIGAGLLTLGLLSWWRFDKVTKLFEFIGSIYTEISTRKFPVKTASIGSVVGVVMFGLMALLGYFGILR